MLIIKNNNFKQIVYLKLLFFRVNLIIKKV